MRRWYMPLTVLGLAGLGALILSPRGRQILALLADGWDAAENVWHQNDALRELERLQAAVNQLAHSLESAG